jgi:hypothetical protein
MLLTSKQPQASSDASKANLADFLNLSHKKEMIEDQAAIDIGFAEVEYTEQQSDIKQIVCMVLI